MHEHTNLYSAYNYNKPVCEAQRGDHEAAAKTHLGFHTSRRRHFRSAPPPAVVGPWRCGGPQPLVGERFSVIFLVCFSSVFFEMLRRRLHIEVRKKSSPLYPRSGGASSTDGERMESFVRQIS